MKFSTKWGISIMLAALAAGGFGCAGEDNRDPDFQPVDDAIFEVNKPGSIDLFATDPDGDALEFELTAIEPEPPALTQTQGATARPTVVQIDLNNARFAWTPGIADAGRDTNETAYSLTFTVSDGNGGADSVTLGLRVVNPGLGPIGGGSIRFIEPVGGGVLVNRLENPSACVDNLVVAVKADNYQATQISLEMVPPILEASTLSPTGTGKTKRFNWCPPDSAIDMSLNHTVVFESGVEGTGERIEKPFQITIKRKPADDCEGNAPEIQHTPPGEYSGPLNYELSATITDKEGVKGAYVVYTADPDANPDDTSGWVTEPMKSEGGERWAAAIPNMNLAEGETATLWYQIVATDDDDGPGSTRCDHTAETPVAKFTVRGGAGNNGEPETYGFCHECVNDAQCGGPGDFCVLLRGEPFCAIACQDGSCAADQTCLEQASVDGVQGFQCVPADLNCGQICMADQYDGQPGADNDDPARATPIQPGTHEGLSICQADEADVYSFDVGAQQSVRVRIEFDVQRADLDLGMTPPGDAENYIYRSQSYENDYEELSEPCTERAGPVSVLVAGFNLDPGSPYSLTVELGPGQCNLQCADDRYQGNQTLEDAVALDSLPVEELGLVLCPRVSDFFLVEASAGDILNVGVFFDAPSDDLNLALFRGGGQVVDWSDGTRLEAVEILETEIPVDDLYVVEVSRFTPSLTTEYDLYIEKTEQMACVATRECGRDQYCAPNGSCQDDYCESLAGVCGQDHSCRAPQSGQDPSAYGGTCSQSCADDSDCRQEAGYRCKSFEDYTRSCLVAGQATVGQRCSSHGDCEGSQICLGSAGGYCAAAGCDPGDCPGGTVCTSVRALGGIFACMKTCSGNGDCRAGEPYECSPAGGSSACLPR